MPLTPTLVIPVAPFPASLAVFVTPFVASFVVPVIPFEKKNRIVTAFLNNMGEDNTSYERFGR